MPTIATSVELIFDEQLSAEIRGIWDSFTGARIRYQPHAEQGHPHIRAAILTSAASRSDRRTAPGTSRWPCPGSSRWRCRGSSRSPHWHEEAER